MNNISLALGAGGARGFAHIVILEILDDLGIKPQQIVGASIGAIMGAAYAGGLSGQDIRAVTLEALASKAKAVGRLWQLRPKNFSELFSTNFTQFNAHSILKAFVGDFIPPRFSQLDIPLQIVATDYYGWRQVIFKHGDLRTAVAASIAIPALFQPVIYDHRLLVDGGVLNPLPFDHLNQNTITVAVDVTGGPRPPVVKDNQTLAKEPPVLPGMRQMIFDSVQLLMQAIILEKLKNQQPRLLIRPIVSQFGVLDFLKVKDILNAVDKERDSIKRQIAYQLEVD